MGKDAIKPSPVEHQESLNVFSAKLSRLRRKNFELTVYSGDWHTPLHYWLYQASVDAQSPRVRDLVKSLLKVLEEEDECVNEITKSIETPHGIQPELLIESLTEGMLHDSLRYRIDDRTIHITATVRGSLDHAKSYVDEEVRRAFSLTRARLSVRSL